MRRFPRSPGRGLWLLVALLVACAPAGPGGAPAGGAKAEGCADRYDAQRDYFPDKMTLKHAKGFRIEYQKNFKVITVTNPWRDAKEQFQYVLVQCGTPAPKSGYEQAQVVHVPIKSIVTMCTCHQPHIEILGLHSQLLGVSDFKWITNANIAKMRNEGKLVEVGSGPTLGVEKVLNLNPDVVMTYGLGDASRDSHPKLREAGVKVAMNSEYMEDSALSRSEWLKFTAAFFNKEAAATKAFDDMVVSYESLAARAKNVKVKPTVFSGVPFQGTWFQPGGNSWVGKLLADAGANYLWADDTSTGSIPLSFEAVFDRAKNADIWINPAPLTTMGDLLGRDSRFSEFGAFKNGRVWHNYVKVNEYGNPHYQADGIASPHLILADLVKILHPHLLPEHQLIWHSLLK